MHNSFEIDSLPFYWRLANKNDRSTNIVNSNFPFEFDVDEKHELLIQKRNIDVLNALNIIYQEESINQPPEDQFETEYII